MLFCPQSSLVKMKGEFQKTRVTKFSFRYPTQNTLPAKQNEAPLPPVVGLTVHGYNFITGREEKESLYSMLGCHYSELY